MQREGRRTTERQLWSKAGRGEDRRGEDGASPLASPLSMPCPARALPVTTGQRSSSNQMAWVAIHMTAP